MSIDSALIVNGDRIPMASIVVDTIRGFGHEVVFPEGFEFAVRDDGLWRTVSLDGAEAGFDYVLSSLDDWEDDDVITFPRNAGDALMEFGARGDASIKLVAHVQRAICKLSGAHGWIEEELIPSTQMIAGCKDTADNWDIIAARLGSAHYEDRTAPSQQPTGLNVRVAGSVCILLGLGVAGMAFRSNLLMTILGILLLIMGIAVFFIRPVEN